MAAVTKTLIILGPTAAGKSKLAIELAVRLNGEVISADSMQVYRGMDIGTAKPTQADRQGIAHHLIDIRDPDQAWTVSDFVAETNGLITEISRSGADILILSPSVSRRRFESTGIDDVVGTTPVTRLKTLEIFSWLTLTFIVPPPLVAGT